MSKDMNPMISQYVNSQINLGDIKQGSIENDISDIKTVNTLEEEANREYERFREKLKTFDSITLLEEAKDTAKKMFNIKDDITYFRAGKAYVTVMNQANFLRIVVNSDKELICYNFDKKDENK